VRRKQLSIFKETEMRLHKNFLIAIAVVIAVAVTAAAAFAGTKDDSDGKESGKNERVRAKVHKGTLTIKGTNKGESLALRLRAGEPNILEVTVDGGSRSLSFDRSDFDKIVVDARGGNDTVTIDEVNGAFTDTEATTINGGNGNDRLIGGSFNEHFDGGDGNDFVDGNRGADVALLGAGDDTFQWDPGDGSDVVEGQAGTDTMLFNGANVGEQIDLSANGPRLRLFRDVGNITMDTAGVENVDVRALGGADKLTVNDLGGTEVKHVTADLAAAGGGGDAQPDQVIVNATNRDDAVTVAGSATVTGLAATVTIAGAEATADTLAINALAGNDVVEASALAADAIQLHVDGGDGDDVLTGGAGNDVLAGGSGDDVLIGGPGIDVLDGGPGNNIVIQ